MTDISSTPSTAIIEHPHFPDTTATSSPDPDADPESYGARHTVLTPNRQAEFLASLQILGNVRGACRAAGVSAQTAYRARRMSPGFALAWDACLLAARTHAEATLADRALNGVEEAVFYHGEEVARRRRYDSRLLLAHLARLDRLEARGDVMAALATLDEDIEGLRRGEAIPDAPPFAEDDEQEWDGDEEGDVEFSQDRVPPVPSRRVRGRRSNARPTVKPCEECGGACNGPEEELGFDDCQWLGNRRERALHARPAGAPRISILSTDMDKWDETEWLQLHAYEADVPEWWTLAPLELVGPQGMYGFRPVSEESWPWPMEREGEDAR